MLASMMADVKRIKAPNTQLYSGLFVTFMGGASEDLIRQIYQSRRLNADGVILFDWAHTTAQYTSTLMASTFNEGRFPESQNKIAQKQKKKIFHWRKNKKKGQQVES